MASGWQRFVRFLESIWEVARGELPATWTHIPAETMVAWLIRNGFLDPAWFKGPVVAFIAEHARRVSPSALSLRSGASLSTIERLRGGRYSGRPRTETFFKIVFGLGLKVPFLIDVDYMITAARRRMAKQRSSAKKQAVEVRAPDADQAKKPAPSAGDDGSSKRDDGTQTKPAKRDDGTPAKPPKRDDGTGREPPARDDGTRDRPPKLDELTPKVDADATIRQRAGKRGRRPLSDERAMLKDLEKAFKDAFAGVQFDRHKSDKPRPNSGSTKELSGYSDLPRRDLGERGEVMDGGPAMFCGASMASAGEGRVDATPAATPIRIWFQGESGYFVTELPQTREDSDTELVGLCLKEVATMQTQVMTSMYQTYREDLRRVEAFYREELRHERELLRHEQERSNAQLEACQEALTQAADMTAAFVPLLEARGGSRSWLADVDWAGVAGVVERLAAKVLESRFGVEETG